MEDDLKFRTLKEEDYETICEWWKWWRWPVLPKESLPDNGKSGFIIEKNDIPIVACFLLITNPKYKEKDRKKAIETLIIGVENICRELGMKHIFSVVKNKHLINTHKKLGWFVDEQPSREIIKNL